MEHTTTPGPSPDAAQTQTSNGVSGQRPNESDDEARRQAMQRAEELVDRWGEQVGRCVSSLGHDLLKWVAPPARKRRTSGRRPRRSGSVSGPPMSRPKVPRR